MLQLQCSIHRGDYEKEEVAQQAVNATLLKLKDYYENECVSVTDLMTEDARKVNFGSQENTYFEPLENRYLSKEVIHAKKVSIIGSSSSDIADNIKVGFTPDQLKWCNEYAGDVWKFMIERQLLYSTNPEETQKFMQDGPFTLSFGKDSPSRIGVWMGWQIVRKYMRENKTVTLEELFMNMDSQSILEKSGYKPQN